MIQSIGLIGFNFLIGWANDVSHASAAHPAGYSLGMGLFTLTALLGFLFACLLRRSERSASGHGLEHPSGRKPAPSSLTLGGYR